MAKKKTDEAADAGDAGSLDEAVLSDATPKRVYAVSYTHSLLGERVIEAHSPEEAVSIYGSLCLGFKSEHPPQVRELVAPAPEAVNGD